MSEQLPPGILLAFYGDDFTGSTDAMEVMAFAGFRTVLFTHTPSPAELARFSGYQVVGIAGTARARSPEWMDENLPSAFEVLSQLRPQILQYKVCSTFDSASHTGSIGRAIDLGMAATGSRWSPSIVGAPQLRRWQVFGNLFAGVGGTRYRIDRHPTMSRHPVTPMREGDLRVHLREQTRRPVEAIDVVEMTGGDCRARVEEALRESGVLFLDVVDKASQEIAGQVVWENRGETLFTASSSGLQYALVAHWRAKGLHTTEAALPEASPVDRLLVLSGSCSPMTAEQIAHAEASGFAALRLDVRQVADPAAAPSEKARVVAEAANAFGNGRSVVVFAAKTVDDEAFTGLQRYCEERGIAFPEAQARIGDALGEIAKRLVPAAGLKRLVIAGGDTSGRVMEALPVFALEAVHPMAIGSPVCRVHAEDRAFDGLEVILKGGQVGDADMFLAAREGRSQARR